MATLFTPYTIRGVEFKNRIVMSPMCMYSSHNQDGKVGDWHKVHYPTRSGTSWSNHSRSYRCSTGRQNFQ